MRKSRRRRKYDYGDMFTKPQTNANANAGSMFSGDSFANGATMPSAASPYYSPENLNTIAKPPDTTPRMSAEQKGSLIGTAGQLVGSAIESKQKLQDTEFTRDLQSSRKEAKAALYGIGTAAAAVNPIVGGAIIAGTAIGSAVGSQTQDEWGAYKSRSGNAIDEMVNPVTGYQGIKRALQGRQTKSGALNKLTLGLFGKSDNQREAEKGKREWEAKRLRSIRDKSQQKLANYNTSGISDYNTMLAMGGFLPKYTKRGKRRYAYGDLVGQPQPKATTDPLEEEEEGVPGQAASPYYSPENLNALTSALKPQPQVNPPPGQTPPKPGSWFNSPKGQAAGGAAMAASNLLPQYDNPNQTAGEKATDQAGTQIAGAIGPWWGALAKVGTTASSHIRKDDDVSHAQGFLGDTVNPFHQFNSFQEGKSREKTAAFLNPVMASHLAADRRKKVAVDKKREKVLEMRRNSQDILAGYNTAGNQYYAKFGMQFPMGGDLPTPTDQGSGEQLASNMAQYHGPTHEGGGIELDTDQNADADIEVEGTEVIKDNMVFSNRLRPSKDVKNIVKSSGVGTRKGDTYATLSARIGKKKGKFEEQMNSTRAGEKNSAQIMQGRLDETANLLFMDQQVRKFKKGANGKYSKSGKFPKGGKIPMKSIEPESVDFLRDQAARYGSNYRKFKFGETPEGVSQEVYDAMRAVGKYTNPMVKGEFLRKEKRRAIYDAMPEFPKGGVTTAPYLEYNPNSPEALSVQKAKSSIAGIHDFRGNVAAYSPVTQSPLVRYPNEKNFIYRTEDLKGSTSDSPRLRQVGKPEILAMDSAYAANQKLLANPAAFKKEYLASPEWAARQAEEARRNAELQKTLTDPTIKKTPATGLFSKRPYGGYVPPGRRRTVQATKVIPPPGPFGAIPAPVVPVTQAPYSTPNFEEQALPKFNMDDEYRRLEALKITPTYPKGGVYGAPVPDPPTDPRALYTSYNPGASPQSQIPVVRSNRRKAIGMQTAILDKKIDLSQMHPDTRFVTDSTASASNAWLMRNDPAYVEAMKDVQRGPLKPIQAYGGYTNRLHKMNDAMKTRAFGGYLPAFADGDKYNRVSKRRDTAIADQWINDPFGQGSSSRLSYTPTLTDPVVKASNTTIAPTPRRFGISDYKGDIAAGIGTIANQIQIGRLETEFNPELADAPRNPYTDRRDYLKQQAGEQYTTATQGVQGSDAQGNLALKANMYAKSLSGLNQQLDQEQQREDAYATKHAELKNRTNLINTQTKNQAKLTSMENRNQKRALTQQNIDNLIRSYQGNEQMRQFMKTDFARNKLINARAGERGVDARTIAALDPETRKILGYEAEGGIFKKGGIYIKPKNRGKFNALKKRTGKTTAQLKHSKNPLTRKRATFAANAKKWKH